MEGTTTENEVPRLQVVEKLMRVPVVEEGLRRGAVAYRRVKGSHEAVTWALDSAEGVLGTAAAAVAPVATRFHQPISGVDSKLCHGLDMIEEKVPIVKDQPEVIYNKAKCYVSQNVSELQSASVRMADRSWVKANQLLSSRCGSVALSGFDATTRFADQVIDYYLPALEGESDQRTHPNTECEDKVLHTIHTIGTLSHKMGSRVYRTLSQHFSEPRQI